MCSKREAQEGIVYRRADGAIVTATTIDLDGGGIVEHVLVDGHNEERFIRNADGSFEVVRFDFDCPKGDSPWKTTGKVIVPPIEIEPVGRFSPSSES
jgi:hypothetical protein